VDELACLTPAVQAEDIGCVKTTWKLIGSNQKICVQAFDDPKVQGASCHIILAKLKPVVLLAP
jgi:CreA protein